MSAVAREGRRSDPLLIAAVALAVAAVIGIVSASLRHTMPRWFTIFGYFVAAIQIGATLALPALLMPIWTLTAGILLLLRPPLGA